MAKSYKKDTTAFFLSSAQDAVELDPVQTEKEKKDPEGVQIPDGYRLVKETKSKRMQLLVRPSTQDALKKAAAREGISVNDLANRIFEEYIEKG